MSNTGRRGDGGGNHSPCRISLLDLFKSKKYLCMYSKENPNKSGDFVSEVFCYCEEKIMHTLETVFKTKSKSLP